MLELLADLLGGLLSALTGFLFKRKQAADAVKASNNQATAEAASGVIRDTVSQQVEQAREANEKATDTARADAVGPSGLRKQSDDVNAAIAQANSELR
ncbi:hypothetical protein [Dyella sp. AD56]|uniref:hypothetical protein n=1 Tax=Dyella sp. AD56 TaxID=1528744 RepID=UPI000C820040|nr:hypothetical protein [Dyella sp. AD56]